MMKKTLLSVILLLAIVFTAHTQQHCFFTHYSTEDGLSQNTVMSILQDHKDNLWFATWDGINRFNGYTFKTYKARQGNYISLTNNRADRMYEDRYGFLWLLTYDNRVHRFDPKTETFEQVPAAGEEGSAFNVHTIEVMPNGTVWLLTENDGAIRILTHPDENHRLTWDIYSNKTELFPSLHVFKVHQDKAGNDWLLTDNGLGMIRPGDKEPVSYFTETKGKLSGMNQAFYAVQERDEDICFASDHGRVWVYQKGSGEFVLLELPTKGRITSIHTVAPDMSVITTDSDGFFTCNLKTKASVHYSFLTCKELPAKPILSAYVDRSSEVWFEQEEPGVVAHFNPFTGVVTREQILIEYSNPERSRPAFHIHEDVNGYLWVHPYGGGFSYFDPQKKRLVPFYNGLGSRDWRFSNKIHSAFSDKQGNLWMCTHSKGLEKVTYRNVPFSMMTPVPQEYESLHNEIRALCEDKQGNLWVGVKDGILRIYDADRTYKGYLTENGIISTVGTPVKGTAYFIIQDSKGVIWIATKGDGLIRAEATSLSGMSYKLTRYLHQEDDMYSLSDNNVYCVYEDHNGRIWAATFAGGINYLTENEDGKVLFINHRNHLKGYPIDPCYKARFITSDNNGRLWVGTTTGAVAFDENFEKPEDVQFYHFSRMPNDTQSLSNNDVHWIIPTTDKELYLATFGGGLNKLISISEDGHGAFKSYSVQDGLPSDVLLSIREDDKQNLWISTENGICKFIPSEERFESYDERSITFPVRFSEAASTLTAKGNMLFGASGGVFIFNPDSIRKSSYVPPIVFSKLTVANEDVVPGEQSLLQADIDDTEQLVLSHDENIFSVQFAALDYTNPQNVQYAYILDGFEKQWTFADKQRSVTYTNLPKGEYVLRVRSTNSDGVWVENERVLDIVILPSFWETPVAYVLYVLLILVIILVAVYILFTIYRLKHEVSIEQQISDIKLRFFTNISHELRTPLTLIAGPVEQVLKNDKLPEDVREQLVVDIANASLQSETLVTAAGPEFEKSSSEEEPLAEDTSKELMLLVEDNQELREFLRSIFTPVYRVVEAADGMEGWSKALKYLPDIIISDVMMPEKDGIEMTRELRADMMTSHIPIILLTAKTTIESKLEGLEYGADDYITKPFSATYLQARVENLLIQRKKLQSFYRDSLMHINMAAVPEDLPVSAEGESREENRTEPEQEAQPAVPDMSPNDRKFMDKLVELMEQNMDNGELVVDDLVRELAVSRSVFFKKLKTLTGLAPIEFIKEIRIKRATQLIETGEFNMTQISYMVGINDPRYFSKCFKAQVGMTPTEYKEKVGR